MDAESLSPRRVLIAGIVVIIAVFALTNSWGSIDDADNPIEGGDAAFYLQIADAAPDLPDEEVGSAYAERFAAPWVAGSTSELFGIGSTAPFWVLTALAGLLVVVVLVDVSRRLGLPAVGALLCVALFVLNPYVLRPYSLGPVSTDLAFVAALSVLIWGLVAKRFGVVLIGAVASVLGRQTALLAVPAAAPWMFWGGGWRDWPASRRAWAIAIAIAAAAITYGLIKLAISSFSAPFAPSIPGDTVLPGVGDSLSLSELGSHVVRVLAPLAVPSACIIGVLAGMATGGRRVSVPVEFWCALLIAAAIIIQPLVISPNFPGFEHNEERLGALGVLPICVALAYLLREVAPALRAAPASVLIVGAVALAAASLHDTFTVIGPSSNGQFVALELVAAVALAAVLAIIVRGPVRPAAPA